MTESDFLNIYSERLQIFTNRCKDEIKKYVNEKPQKISDQINKHNFMMSERGNLLVLEILSEFNIDHNYGIITSDLTKVPLSSVLLHKTFSIQLKFRKEYSQTSDSILSEALCRDFPDDCLKGL